jgi:hypothetical protein
VSYDEDMLLGVKFDNFGYDQYFDDTFDDVDVWRRLGKAIQGIDLDEFDFCDTDVDITPPQQPHALMLCLVRSSARGRSIEKFLIYFYPSNQVPMFGLRQFVTSNKSLRELKLFSHDILTPDQTDVLQGAIPVATQLKNLAIDGCHFANDGLLEQLLSACTKVKDMHIQCKFISQYTGLSAFLQDPTNSMEKLPLRVDNRLRVRVTVEHKIAREVTSGLSNNTKFKSLGFTSYHWQWQREKIDYFANGCF